MSALATGIAAGMKSAIAHAKGKLNEGTVEHILTVPDVKANPNGAGPATRSKLDSKNDSI